MGNGDMSFKQIGWSPRQYILNVLMMLKKLFYSSNPPIKLTLPLLLDSHFSYNSSDKFNWTTLNVALLKHELRCLYLLSLFFYIPHFSLFFIIFETAILW